MLHLRISAKKMNSFLIANSSQPPFKPQVLAKVPGWRKPAGLLTLGKGDSETRHCCNHHTRCAPRPAAAPPAPEAPRSAPASGPVLKAATQLSPRLPPELKKTDDSGYGQKYLPEVAD